MNRRTVTPKHPTVGVIGLMPDAWGPRWSPRHHVMSQLSRWFPVVWINPRHRRDELWTEARRRLRQPYPDVPGDQFPNLTLYQPELWLPELFRPRWLAGWSLRLLLQRAARSLRRRGAHRILVYAWHPRCVRALDAFPEAQFVYHIDDEYSFADEEVPNSPEEVELIRRADQVIVHSKRLLEKKGGINPRTALVPNGVDFLAFTTARPEPADLAAIPRPRAGYVGALKKHLDWELLDRVAASQPRVSFVFVGDREPHPEIDKAIARMSARPNVHFLGVHPTREIPGYVQHLDVCLLPYRRMAYTDYIYPLKLHEYLAAGRPVVGTPIPSLQEFASVIWLESTTKGWCAALTEALSAAESTPDAVAERREIAAGHDWSALVGRIADLITQRVDAVAAAG